MAWINDVHMFKYLLCRELECGKRKQWWSKKALLGHPKGRIDWVQPSGQIFWVLCQKETAMKHQGEGRHRPLWTKTDAVGQEKHVGKKKINKIDCVSSSNRWFRADSECGMVTSVEKVVILHRLLQAFFAPTEFDSPVSWTGPPSFT